jgi:two-component system heavy metal sensor histidine kinase CusS
VTTEASAGVSIASGRRSLAIRLAAWFALSSFVLIAIATVSLYLSVNRYLHSAESHLITDRVRTVRSILDDSEMSFAELVDEVEREWPGGPNAHIFARVLGKADEVIAETRGMSERDLPASAFPAPNPGVATGHLHWIESSGGLNHRFHLYSVRVNAGVDRTDSVVLQLAVDATEHDTLLATYRSRVMNMLIVMFFITSTVGFAIALRGLRPIGRFEEALSHIRSTTLHERLDPSGMPTELSLLAKTCNEMLDGLEEAFTKLSRFSADIAHELRTPINNLRGSVEIAMSRERSREEYRAALESCLEDTDRLTKLIDSLLFLARAEGAKVTAKREPLDINAELVAVAELYEALASEGGVKLSVVPNGTIVAKVDRTLFQSAVGNLVHNAITATPPGGSVWIRAAHDGPDVSVEVSDTGRGIAETDLPRVFDRLFRADVARSGVGASGGAGLGLSIVRSIAALHQGSASIRSEEGVGTVATLRFPASMTTS